MTKSFLKIGSLIAGIGASFIAAFSFKEAIRQASAEQSALNRLAFAFQANGIQAESATEKFKEFAERLQATTIASNDQVLAGGNLLVSLGRLSGEGLERASKAAVDLAAGLNIDVGQAFEALSRASAGNMRGLQQFGIRVTDTGNKVENFNEAIRKIEERFGGQGAAALKTFDGALIGLQHNFEDFLKSIGKAIVDPPKLVAAINFISKEIVKLTELVSKSFDSKAVDQMVLSIISFSIVLSQSVLPVVEVIGRAVDLGITRLLNFGTVLRNLFSGNLTEIITKMGEDTKAKLESLFNLDTTTATQELLNNLNAMVTAAEETMKRLGGVLSKPIDEFGETIRRVMG
jgi:uncharacterized coiled-coil protein SlyX